MACGFGACLGCVVKVKSQKAKGKNEFEYKRACKDGPVFNAQELIF
jgi:dihydroorotate dehydrogenase electron transfer subunit